jgi:anti-sigma B factor antagonist
MGITSTTSEGVVFLEVSGEVDMTVADELRDAGIAALTPLAGTVRIDLAEVTFMDSSGLAALVAIRNRAGAEHLVIVQNPQRNVQRVLELSGLDHVFHMQATEPV